MNYDILQFYFFFSLRLVHIMKIKVFMFSPNSLELRFVQIITLGSSSPNVVLTGQICLSEKLLVTKEVTTLENWFHQNLS